MQTEEQKRGRPGNEATVVVSFLACCVFVICLSGPNNSLWSTLGHHRSVKCFHPESTIPESCSSFRMTGCNFAGMITPAPPQQAVLSTVSSSCQLEYGNSLSLASHSLALSPGSLFKNRGRESLVTKSCRLQARHHSCVINVGRFHFSNNFHVI